MLSTTDGSHGSDRLSNISTDFRVCVLSSTDGSLGSDRLPNISTDSEVCVLSSIDGSLRSDKLPNICTDFLEFLWKFLEFLEDLGPLATIAWNFKDSGHIILCTTPKRR